MTGCRNWDGFLDKKLISYAQSNSYPFHMPGHKRQMRELWDAYEMDITEIDGFDNLNNATGILKEAQERAAELYGARRSFYLVNGSTCGLLAAICAAAPKGSRILMGRNCHKAAYHGVFLAELSATYLYPAMAYPGICGQITPESLRLALDKRKDYAALVLTSPTYEGICSDVEELAAIAHAHGIPVIVDEAHGAHFGLSAHFPKSAVTLGADVVIQSLHKTLPSFTQTALLHVCSDRVSEEKVESYLQIFETSSPSYVLMAGMERCIRLMAEQGRELFVAYRHRLDGFYDRVRDLGSLKVLCSGDYGENSFQVDASKIVISTERCGISGVELSRRLREDYGLEMEMAAPCHVLAMTSVMDTEEGFLRLADALMEIDHKLQQQKTGTAQAAGRPDRAAAEERSDQKEKTGQRYVGTPGQPGEDRVLTVAEAAGLPYCEVPLPEALGRICAAYICLYPPGIPLVVPGEPITADFLSEVESYRQAGLEIMGLSANNRIKVVILDGLYYT